MPKARDLATHQRAMLALMRGSDEANGTDDYLEQVARSRDLAEARRNILLWRLYVLERTCVLTIALLRWQGSVDATLEAFIRQNNISPIRESQPVAFLEFLASHPDPLVVSVSQFERAFMKARGGDEEIFEISWPVEPRGVLSALAKGEPLEGRLRPGDFVVRVSGRLPHLFDVASTPRLEVSA